MTGDVSAARRKPPAVWILACITLSGTFAMHLLVPALPAAARAFGVPPATAALMITFYVAGLALGQLLYGPPADCFGRRPALLGGLMLYTVAGVLAALAPRIEVVLAARFLQAAGGCAGLLIGRAIVQDTCETGEAVSRLALMTAMALLGPGLAPLAGALAAELWGWRSLLLLLAGLGTLNVILAWRYVPETCTPSGLLSVKSVVEDYRRLFGSCVFSAYAMAGGIATTSFYAFIAASPFIYAVKLRRPMEEVGLYLGLMIAGTAVGTAAATGLARTLRPERMCSLANGLSGLSAGVLLAFVISERLTPTCVAAAMFVFAIGVGACGPATLVKALGVDRQRVGAASGLYGAIQMGVGALCTALGTAGEDTALTAAAVLAIGASVAQMLLWVGARAERHGMGSSAPAARVTRAALPRTGRGTRSDRHPDA